MNAFRKACVNGGRLAAANLRISARTPRDLIGYVVTVGVFLWLARFEDTPAERGSVIAGGIAAQTVMVCWVALPQVLNQEREEGALLRMRSAPDGIRVYLFGRLMYYAVIAVVTEVAMTTIAVTAYSLDLTPGAVWTVVWSTALGFAATAPLGILLSLILPASRQAAVLAMIPLYALMFISGIYVPLTGPDWLVDLGHVFPVSWFADLTRGAFLPGFDSPESWKAVTVMAAWAVAGTAAAVPALRLKTRRESGSRLTARKERALARPAIR